MSSFFSRGPKAPYIPVSAIQPGAIGPAESRRAAFAFGFGEHRPSADPPPPQRASRRGDLPDIDFSQAVRLPRRSIWSRIVAAFRANSSEAIASEEPMLDIPHISHLAPADGAKVIQFRRAA